jgi:methylmalonyl-CoA/ethylmalonyl-CoA epimerase
MADSGPAVTLSRIGQIAIRVRDLARAVAFYRDVLGLPLLFQVPSLAFFNCGGIRLMLGTAETAEFDHPASIVYYHVSDLHGAVKELESRGVKIDREPHLIARMPDHELWMAFLRDSEDNPLALMCEVKPA